MTVTAAVLTVGMMTAGVTSDTSALVTASIPGSTGQAAVVTAATAATAADTTSAVVVAAAVVVVVVASVSDVQ